MADSLPTTAPTSRLRTPLPKVGIRPTIDGRYGGVRESLEGPVMAMAQAVADHIRAHIRHASGDEVEVIIANRPIGGGAEAAECAAQFAREGVGVSLTVTPCWCYGAETMDMDPTVPKAIWGFNGTERPGAVYLAATLAGHSQKGLPCFGIYGREVQDLPDVATIPDDVSAKILRFVRAGLVVATMRGNSYLSIGGTSMGIGGSLVDPSLWQRYFGMRVMPVDMSELVGRMNREMYDVDEWTRARAWVKANCKEGRDVNPTERQRTRAEKDTDWDTCVKMTLIARDLMIGSPRLTEMGFPEQGQGHNALAAGFQGQRQWTDHFPNGDFLEAVLCSSFDWNGIRQPFIMATENDALNAASMLFGHLLTGTAQMFSDVRTYWSPDAIQRVTGWSPAGRASDGLLHLINSGPTALDWTGHALKPWWEITSADAQASLGATEWCASDRGYFPAGGWSTDFTTLGDIPVTMCRLNLVQGLGPVLSVAEGWTVGLPDNVHAALDERTSPSWPTTWFAPRLTGEGAFSSAYNVMAHWGANHGAISAGHIGADLLTLASMLRIPVDLHNVDTDDVFRPSSWHRFGSGLDITGADYRACTTYGPLYG